MGKQANLAKLVGATVFALCLIAPVQAGLLGDTVGTRYVGAGDTGVLTATVGPGEEGSFFGSQFFDYGDFSFSIRSSNTFGGIFTSSPTEPVSLELSDLDFGAPLTSVTFTSSLDGVLVTSLGPENVTFTWQEQDIPANTYLSATFNVGVIPEPEIYAMLAAGLGLMGFVARRRKQQIDAA